VQARRCAAAGPPLLPAALLTGRTSAGRARERRTRRVVDVSRVRGHACGPSARSSPKHVSDWCHTLSSKLLWSLRVADVPDLNAACMHGAKVRKSGQRAGTRSKGCPGASPRRPSALAGAAQHTSCARDRSRQPSLGRRKFSTFLQTFRQAAAALSRRVCLQLRTGDCGVRSKQQCSRTSAVSVSRRLQSFTSDSSSPSVPGVAPHCRSCDAVLST